MPKKTQEQFILDAIEVHGDKYDYSKVNYVLSNEKVIIICKVHGDFLQLPRSHLTGRGCINCCNESQTKTKEQFILDAQKIHGDKYDYSSTEYKTMKINIDIMCKIHGIFSQTPTNHLKGHGCSSCNRRKGNEKFINEAKEVHGNIYDYSKVDYILSHEKIKIICPKHGEFTQTPAAHLIGQGCSNCVNKTEGKIKRFLEMNKIKFETQIKADNKQFDFLINDDFILEIDGTQHFHDIKGQNKLIPTDRIDILNNDIEKMKSVIDYYPIIRLFQKAIWEDKYDWKTLLLNMKNLEVGTLYIRSDERELYKNHIKDFTYDFV